MNEEMLNSNNDFIPIKNGLEKAYSSQLHLEHRQYGDVVVKTVNARERKNEIYFQEQMRNANLPAMHVREEGENLEIDFIKDAETLGDSETVENYQKFGESVKNMHSIRFDHPAYMDEGGHKVDIFWKDFIQQLIEGKRAQGEFDEQTTNHIIEAIKSSTIGNNDMTVLLHGDLHPNNVLLKDEKVILFDKADQIVSGDPMYDLALIAINLPGAIYKLGTEIKRDESLLKAFINGYNFDFTVNKEKLNAYVLLRALERWPTPFEKEIPDIVAKILSKKV